MTTDKCSASVAPGLLVTASLLGGTGRDDNCCRPQQPVLEAIPTADLTNDRSFGSVAARLMCDRFVQIRVEFLPHGVDRPKTIIGEKLIQLFEDKIHPGIDGRVFALLAHGVQTKLEVIDDGDESLEERAVRVFDGFLLLTSAPLFVILEIGLTPERQIAEPVKVGLQTGHRVFGFGLRSCGRGGRLLLRDCRAFSCRCCVWVRRGGLLLLFPLLAGFGDRNFFHVFRIAIKVTSSFCGRAPTKLRTSSMSRVTMAAAPFVALARTDSTIRSSPNSLPSPSMASVTPSV